MLKILTLIAALLAAAPAWAGATITVDTGGLTTNSGTNSTIIASSGGTPGASFTNGGAFSVSANGSFTTASTTITLVTNGCTVNGTVTAGMGVWDSTVAATNGFGQSKTLIGVVASCSGTTLTLTGSPANPHNNSVGAADSLFFTPPITLDTNTNLTALPGCATTNSQVFCDMTQAINLANASNTSLKDFWIATYTGCTGTGSCSITVTGMIGQASPAAPACSTCTGSAWTIGGLYQWPGTTFVDVVAKALRPGDTLTFTCTGNPATRSGVNNFLSVGNSGDQVTGPIIVNGAAACRPVLTQSGSVSTLNISASSLVVSNLEFQQTGTGTSTIGLGGGSNIVLNNIKVTACAAGDGLNIGAGITAFVIDSSFTGCAANGINTLAVNNYFYGNYLNGNANAGILMGAAGITATVANNLIVGNTGKGLVLTGSPSAGSGRIASIVNNTIANNAGNGFEVQNQNYQFDFHNNIFQNNGGAGGYNVTWTPVSSSAEMSGFHAYNLYYSSSCLGGGALPCVNHVTPNFFANSGEVTSDAMFVNAGTGNYALAAGSPALGTGYPGGFLGASTTGAMSIGAVQSAGSSGNKFVGN